MESIIGNVVALVVIALVVAYAIWRLRVLNITTLAAAKEDLKKHVDGLVSDAKATAVQLEDKVGLHPSMTAAQATVATATNAPMTVPSGFVLSADGTGVVLNGFSPAAPTPPPGYTLDTATGVFRPTAPK
jgi:hypothetical protein